MSILMKYKKTVCPVAQFKTGVIVMFKILKKGILIAIILFLVYWGGSILKCEILTYRCGHEFEAKIYDMVGETEYLKVLKYSPYYAESYAFVYYVSKNRTCGKVYLFDYSHERLEWEFVNNGVTVWSKDGSTNGFVWPYIR